MRQLLYLTIAALQDNMPHFELGFGDCGRWRRSHDQPRTHEAKALLRQWLFPLRYCIFIPDFSDSTHAVTQFPCIVLMATRVGDGGSSAELMRHCITAAKIGVEFGRGFSPIRSGSGLILINFRRLRHRICRLLGDCGR